MTLEFPANPAAQTPINVYGPDSTPDATTNGVTYTWTGTHWSASVPETYASGPLAGFRNQIINGGFNVWQRGNPVNITGGGSEYTADRWLAVDAADQAVFINDDSNCPSGLGITIPNVGTFLYTPLELPSQGKAGPFRGQYTLSFYSTNPISADPTSYLAEFRDAAVSSSNNVQLTVPPFEETGEVLGPFTRYSTTIDIDALPNSTNLCLILGVTTTAANHTFTSFQFEPGPVATPFEHRPIATELAMCQRYYQTFDRFRLYAGNTESGLSRQFECPRPVIMRVTPTETSDGPITHTGTAANFKSEGNASANTSGLLMVNYQADAEF